MNTLENITHFEQVEGLDRFFIYGSHAFQDTIQIMLAARFPGRFYGYLSEHPTQERHPRSAYSYRHWRDCLGFLGKSDYVFMLQGQRELERALQEQGVRYGLPYNVANIYQTYETPTFLHFCKTYLNQAGPALDVGGNTGLTGAMLASFCQHVYIFEANPAMEAAIRGTTHGLGNVSVIMKAVAANPGSINIYPVGVNNTSAVAHDKSVPTLVPCVSLDAYCNEQGIEPAVIKIDVEGVDGEVILGAARIIEKHRPLMFLEHPLFNAASYDTDMKSAVAGIALLERYYDLLAYPTLDQLYDRVALGMPLPEFERRYGGLPVNVAAIPKPQ